MIPFDADIIAQGGVTSKHALIDSLVVLVGFDASGTATLELNCFAISSFKTAKMNVTLVTQTNLDYHGFTT